MSQTLADLINSVYSYLAEGRSSTAAALTTGSGGIQITADKTITEYLNNAAADFARGCYPIADATGTAATAANQEVIPFSSITLSNNSALWAVDGVEFGGVQLAHIDPSTLRSYHGNFMTEPAGTPKYWYESGNNGVAIWPKSGSTGTATFLGLAIPKVMYNSALVISAATAATPIAVTTASAHNLKTGDQVSISGGLGNTAVNGSWVVTVTGATTFTVPGVGSGSYTANSAILADVPTWFDQDLYKLTVFHAASMYASKNLQRADLAQRAGTWMGMYNQGREGQLEKLWLQDPRTARAHFPRPQQPAS